MSSQRAMYQIPSSRNDILKGTVRENVVLVRICTEDCLNLWKNGCFGRLMYRQGNTSENLQRVEPAKGKSDDIEIIEIDEDEDCDAVVAKDPTPSEVPVDSDCALEVEDSEDDSLTLGVSSQNIPVECILSAEEAFFLAFVCGYLEVRHRDSSRALHLEELWRYFTMRDSNFVFKYAAYHRYRCKGWIVRDGLRFGGDFLLYKDGPSLYHASYLVIVNPPDDAGRFLDFQGRMRLAKNVGKQLLLCHVRKRPDWNGIHATDDVRGLKGFRIKEVVCKRWNPLSPFAKPVP